MSHSRWTQIVLLLLGTALGALIFSAYLQASFMLDLANRLLLCL